MQDKRHDKLSRKNTKVKMSSYKKILISIAVLTIFIIVLVLGSYMYIKGQVYQENPTAQL